MKKLHLLLAAGVFCANISHAQTTVTFKPGPATGQDAGIMTTYGCTPAGQSGPSEGLNGGGGPEMDYMDWTYNAVGCSHGTSRSLVQFVGVSSIPSSATILSATLTLHGVTSSGNWGNSSFSGSPYGTSNDGWVQEVTSPWSESTVTWNTQPSTTTTNRVALAPTTSQFGYTASVNVTPMVQDMVTTGNNNGFMMLLQNESIYRAVLLATSNNPDSTLWPELTVTYSTCYSDFTYCVSTSNPYFYTFTDDNPQPGDMLNWTVDGMPIGASISVPYMFPGPGNHTVCLSVSNNKGRYQCSKCINLCIDQNAVAKAAPAHAAPVKTTTAPQLSDKVVGDRDLIKVADISPNPSSTGWYVNIKSLTRTDADITIYDLQGNMLKTEHRTLSNGDNKIFESAEKMGTGVFLIEIKTAKFTVKERLQKI